MGHDRELEAFLAEHAPALTRLAYQLTHDRAAAEDLVQDVLLAAYRRWDRVRRADAPLAYVRRMLLNAHLNATRRQPPTSAWSERAEQTERAGPVDELVERDALWRALGRLSPRQRAVLVLRHYEGCEDAEIAVVLGCRRASVRSLAARGLALLRDDLARPDRPDPQPDPQPDATATRRTRR